MGEGGEVAWLEECRIEALVGGMEGAGLRLYFGQHLVVWVGEGSLVHFDSY